MPSRPDAPAAAVGLAWLATAVVLCVVALAWSVEEWEQRHGYDSDPPFERIGDGISALSGARRVLLAVGLLAAVPAVWRLRSHPTPRRLAARCVGATLAWVGALGLVVSIAGQLLAEPRTGWGDVNGMSFAYDGFWHTSVPLLMSSVLFLVGVIVWWSTRTARRVASARAPLASTR